MNSFIPEKLLINLNILSKIEKNGRITKSIDGVISLEQNYFYQSIKRFINNDSRKKSIQEINSLLNECFDKVKEICNSKFMNYNNIDYLEQFISNCELLLILYKSIFQAKKGIENLKFTYSNDYNTISQLDITLIRIDNLLKEVKNKFVFYNSKLSSDNKIKYDDSLFENKNKNVQSEHVQTIPDSVIDMQSFQI